MGADVYPLQIGQSDTNLMTRIVNERQSGGNAEQPREDQFNQLKGEFLASLNHELRTPLSGVLGMTDLLLETKLDAEQRDYVDAVRECAAQLLESLNALLDYSALSAGSLQVQHSEFILPALLEGLASEAQVRCAGKGLPFVTRWGSNLPESVVGDERYLRQVLQNLLRNAVKFTSRGQIVLEVAVETPAKPPAPGCPLLFTARVIDSGIGISPDKLRLIFESFRQLDSGLARTYTGLGLGLALADKLASLMGGSISVESEVGQGSTFTLRVPLGVAADSRASHSSDAKRRILVVDDNAIAQQIVGHLLGRAGYEVALADDGESAVRMAATGMFDLVLMDLHMPGMDGLAATRIIRKNPLCKDLPVFALSANYSDDQRTECKQVGMQGFLSKPVHKEELLRTVQAYAPLMPAAAVGRR